MISEMDEARLTGIMHPKVQAMYDAMRRIESMWVTKDLERIEIAVLQGKLARLGYVDYLKDREDQEG